VEAVERDIIFKIEGELLDKDQNSLGFNLRDYEAAK
jgi:hypothetical protein